MQDSMASKRTTRFTFCLTIGQVAIVNAQSIFVFHRRLIHRRGP